jgi:hypothetical protein
MKNSNDTIGNRTRDLPVCSAVPQPTAPNNHLSIDDVPSTYFGLSMTILREVSNKGIK